MHEDSGEIPKSGIKVTVTSIVLSGGEAADTVPSSGERVPSGREITGIKVTITSTVPTDREVTDPVEGPPQLAAVMDDGSINLCDRGCIITDG